MLRMLKKIVSCNAVVCSLLLFPLVSHASWVDDGDFKYDVNFTTKEGKLAKYAGTATEVTIPSSFRAPETYWDDDGEYKTRYHTIKIGRAHV